jgi:hypothetical protein
MRSLWLALAFAFLAVLASAQAQTGTPPFASFGGGVDGVNLANLNVHLTISDIRQAGSGTKVRRRTKS